MNPKEIKTALKSAKECLDGKDFATALIHCKNVLKNDRNNYMALVLFGASLQETDQAFEAPKAFKKATQVAPDQVLAWKGLASFYEKQNNEAHRCDLLTTYKQLLRLESDNSKVEEWVRKMGILLSLLTDDDINSFWSEISEFSEDKKVPCRRMVLSVLASYEKDLPASFLPIAELLLETYKDGEFRQNCISVYKKYLKLLYKMKDFPKLLAQAKLMYDRYPDIIAGPEWYCKGYLEGKFESALVPETSEPSDMYIILLNMCPSSYLGFTCKGVDELACQELVAACETLTQAVALKSTYGIAWYLLTQAQIWLLRYVDAERSARQALEYWKPNSWNVSSLTNCKFWLAKSLCEQDDERKLIECIRIADEFIFDNSNFDFLPILVKACIKLKDERYEKYKEMLDKQENLVAEKCILEAFRMKENGETDEALRLLQKATTTIVDNYNIWLLLGMLNYEKKDASATISCLLKAAKLNQWCHTNFCYLGHCYKNLIRDLTKARRCYQKAFNLNPCDMEAGVGLSDVYRMQGMEEENMTLLTVATQDSGARWAWLKLGLHYLSLNKPVEAVTSLRVAIRLDSNDKNVWESLGDAYLALGSYSAAVKSYQKVLEWDPDQVYPLLQIASIKHLQELDQESVEEFRHVLRLAPDFLSALRGHAVSCLSLMERHLAKNLNGLAGDACQEAVNSLVRALELKKDLIGAWKLLNNACILIGKLPSKYCSLEIPSWLWLSSEHDKKEKLTLKKSDILQLGVRCCCNAIALNPQLSDLWYDLAVCYYHLADAATLADDKKSSRLLSLAATKKSLKLKENSSISWNLFGIISMTSECKNYPIAQHAFVKALQIEEESSVIWCNLGSLYLRLGELQLANQCFTEAQRCDPDYVESWVGQHLETKRISALQGLLGWETVAAKLRLWNHVVSITRIPTTLVAVYKIGVVYKAMLAETTQHHEAMDLYRHSTQLGFHPEGALGYACMVLRKVTSSVNKTDKDFIFSIKNMNAVPTACDSLVWYTDRYPSNACAYNMLGLVQERMGLYNSAVKAFQSSLNILNSQQGDSEDFNSQRDKVLHNYGRTLLAVGNALESVSTLKQIKKATFANQCTLAAAYLRAGQLDEAYSTYESTLEWLAPNDESKSHVLVAMAAVVYVHQGHADAKLLLIQACQLRPVSVAGLFSCCALGLLHADLPLTELALRELSKYRNDDRYLANIALFEAYIFLLKGKDKEAIRALSKAVHRHPNNPMLWHHLSQVQLHLYSKVGSKSAVHCSMLALYFGRSSIDVSKVTSLVSLSHLLSGNGQRSLRAALKAVRLYPDVAENFVVLIAAVLSQALSESDNMCNLKWLKEIITHVRRRLEASRPITQWLSNCERKVLVESSKE